MKTPPRTIVAVSTVWRGEPFPLGATWDGQGVNFALYSENAERVELCLFDPKGRREIERIEVRERTDFVWHCYLPDARPGASLQRAQAAARPVCTHAVRPDSLERCSVRLPRRLAARGLDARHAR